jgi:hypothetical protein
MLMYWFMFGLFAFAAVTFKRVAPARAVAGAPAAVPTSERASLAPLLAGIFLVAVIGLRYRVGGDWAAYLEAHRTVSAEDLFDAISTSRTEPGYTFVSWLAGQLGAGVWLVNVACAALFTAGLLRICKEQPNPWLALVIATPFLIIVVGMGFTRQAAALGALLLGIAHFIERRSLGGFVAWALMGALFHKTDLFFIPIVLLAGAQNRTVAVFLCAVAIVLGYLVVLRGGAAAYEMGYIRAKLDSSGAQIRVLMNVVAAVILLLSKDRFYASREEKVVWRSFAFLALLTGAALFAVSSSAVVDRMSMYLIPLQIFVFTRIPTVFAPPGQPSHALRFLIVLYSAAVLFVWLNYAVNAGSWVPYRSYLQGPA